MQTSGFLTLPPLRPCSGPQAIDLIDEAGSRVRLRHAQLPEEARELDKELRALLKEKDAAVRCVVGLRLLKGSHLPGCVVQKPAYLCVAGCGSLSTLRPGRKQHLLKQCPHAPSHLPLPPRSAQDFEKAGSLRDREMELKSQIAAITSRWAGAGVQGAAAAGKQLC